MLARWILIPLALLMGTSAQAWETGLRQQLRANWVDHADVLDADHLNRLFGVLERDPESARMLQSLKDLTGKQTAFELLSVIRLCPLVPGQELSLKPVDTAGRTNIVEGQPRTICLDRSLSLGDAFSTLVHELTHYLRLKSYCSLDPRKFRDEHAYALAAIQQPGDEMDAFITEIRARIPLEGTRDSVFYYLRESFDDSGNLYGTKEEFAELLLAMPGYQENFAKRYATCTEQWAKAGK